MKKVYIDANIMMDFLDNKREYTKNGSKIDNFKNLHIKAINLFQNLTNNNIILLISEDVMTNIAYNLRNKKDLIDNFVDFIGNVDRLSNFDIVYFGKNVISNFVAYYKQNNGNIDFEDALQYFCALENGCERIYTNDKSSFPRLDIPLYDSDDNLFYLPTKNKKT